MTEDTLLTLAMLELHQESQASVLAEMKEHQLDSRDKSQIRFMFLFDLRIYSRLNQLEGKEMS
jgi:hypothetical protein